MMNWLYSSYADRLEKIEEDIDALGGDIEREADALGARMTELMDYRNKLNRIQGVGH